MINFQILQDIIEGKLGAKTYLITRWLEDRNGEM
jgi:hypothetical protein